MCALISVNQKFDNSIDHVLLKSLLKSSGWEDAGSHSKALLDKHPPLWVLLIGSIQYCRTTPVGTGVQYFCLLLAEGYCYFFGPC